MTAPTRDKSRDKEYPPEDLPEPGSQKSNPKELDRELDVALEQTMDASDPPSVTMPEVKIKDKDGNPQKDGKNDKKRPGRT